MPAARKGASRNARTVRSIVTLSLLGAILAGYNAYSIKRDTQIATGPHSEAQHQFFLASADRPDIDLFFKRLTPSERLKMAERIGEYDDPELAALIGKLLGSFDSQAREVLTRTLTKIGRQHPEAVAKQLNQSGSLQLLALSTALSAVGTSALAPVAQQLTVTDARPNAVAFLVSAGSPAVPFVLPFLNDASKDVRLAAADALGKIGDRRAVPALLVKYDASQGDERFGYLSALAAIGAPSTEALLTRASEDADLSTPRRAQAMLGLGRIGSTTSVAKLWTFAKDDDAQIRLAMISALQLAGNRGLAVVTDPAIGLRVAAGIKSPEATAYIARMLSNPATMQAAADSAGSRPELVGALVSALARNRDGSAIDAAMRALSLTPNGLAALRGMQHDPTLGGFAMRRLHIAGS